MSASRAATWACSVLLLLALFAVVPSSMASAAVASRGVSAPAGVADQERSPVGPAPVQPTAAALLPTPYFIARQTGMTTSFDATGSTPPSGRTITSYQWYFGDGTTDVGPLKVHTYSTPNRYEVNLTVTDSSGAVNSATRFVSANTTTVDILADQFFESGCPYRPYWSLRFHTYGDVILQDPAGQWGSMKGPCVDFQPWVLYASAQPDVNPSWLYSLYHVDMLATNNLGYNVHDPVVLPIFNASVAPAPDSYVFYNFSFDYLDSATIMAFQNGSTWPVNSKYSDGFGYLVRGNITMDLQESKRIFGVLASTPAEAQAWWNANTKPGGQPPLVGVESQFGTWLDDLGNVKYDIYNGFWWYYESDIVDLNATVDPTTGQTHISTFFDGWGWDVLMSRWFYWGNTSYKDAVNAPYGQYKPRGWMPFETCWCENATVNLAIRHSMDAHMSATSEYVFGAVGNPGLDGVYGTIDDVASWSFAPTLMDYMPPVGSGLPGASSFPNSELKWYIGQNEIVTTPGSYAYGQYYEYMTVPNRWNTSLGNTLTLVMPTTEIPWYDPVKSTWNPATHIGNYAEFNSTLTLRSVTPVQGDYYRWDDRGKVLSLAWPAGFTWAQTGLPLDPAPAVEFEPNVDLTPPRTTAVLQGTAGSPGWFLSNVTVTLNAIDDLSGVNLTRYQVDGGSWVDYAQPFTVSGSGAHTVLFYSTDVAGNSEAPASALVRIDLTVPTLTLTAPASVVGTNAPTIAWSGSDAMSGIAGYAVSLDGGTFVSTGMATSHTVTLPDGAHTVRVRATSGSGSTATVSRDFRVDTSFFSLTGPYSGLLVLLILIAVGAILGAAWFVHAMRRSRPPQPPAAPPASPP